jgi:cell wall-associated NlpC family hydrolase
MALFDVDELIDNMTNVFDRRDAEDILEQERGDPTLKFWEDEGEEEHFWSVGRNDETRDRIEMMTVTPKEQRLAEETLKGATPGSPAQFQAAQAATGLQKLTTERFVRKALAKEGMDYVWGGESRAEGGWDCSGLIVGILRNNGFSNFPRLTSSGLIDYAKPMSVKKALKTRGALLWHEGHIAISLGNGKTIEALNSNADIVIGSAQGRFTQAGILPELTQGSYPKGGRRPKPRIRTRPVARKAEVRAVDPIEVGDPFENFDSALPLVALDVVDEVTQVRERGQKTADGLSPIERAMRKGFLDAGRPDLARMVGTRAFSTWVAQETGIKDWATNRDAGRVTSPANNQGLPNDGFFQVWRGHDYNSNGEVARMSPREQAQLIASRFDLTAEDIRNYARAIRAGTYQGWG